ncbi:unnamed protein product [Callosobruchus maculatus]|uniref:C-type lectin domain-containing protein n=1 Tax=Callosobruchus maculatus TaxID=64391 RepID=A0A653C1C4_CALMS|nr:unnamed protein product [Callosobruchus maculatus]
MFWDNLTVYFTLSICMLTEIGYSAVAGIPDNTYFLTSAVGLPRFKDSREKEWVWMSSGKYMAYTNWNQLSNDLSYFDSNICATILYSRNNTNPISWTRADCSDTYHYICQTGPNADHCRNQLKTKPSYPEVIVPE